MATSSSTGRRGVTESGSIAAHRAAAELARIERAIAANSPCRCGHPLSHHDAGECWTTPDGQETHGETSCRCGGYDPVESGSTAADYAGPYTEQETTK